MIRVNSKRLPKSYDLRNPCISTKPSTHLTPRRSITNASHILHIWFSRKPFHKTNCSRNNFPKTNASQNGFPYARIGNNECHHRSSVKTMSRMSIFPQSCSEFGTESPCADWAEALIQPRKWGLLGSSEAWLPHPSLQQKLQRDAC